MSLVAMVDVDVLVVVDVRVNMVVSACVWRVHAMVNACWCECECGWGLTVCMLWWWWSTYQSGGDCPPLAPLF